MKVGFRTPSIKRSIKARTTGRAKRAIKKSVNPLYGKKGMGYIKDPKRAVKQKIYHKTTFGVSDIAKTAKSSNKNTSSKKTTSKKSKKQKSSAGYGLLVLLGIGLFIAYPLLLIIPGVILLIIIIYKIAKKRK